jgi:hypothetical protein
MMNDTVGKLFIVVSTNGDLPTNQMRLRECVVCGGVFTRNQSREHCEIPCPPSLLRIGDVFPRPVSSFPVCSGRMMGDVPEFGMGQVQ